MSVPDTLSVVVVEAVSLYEMSYRLMTPLVVSGWPHSREMAVALTTVAVRLVGAVGAGEEGRRGGGEGGEEGRRGRRGGGEGGEEGKEGRRGGMRR